MGSNNDNHKDNYSENGSIEALSKKRSFDHTRCPSALRFRERTGWPRLELSLLLSLWAMELPLRKTPAYPGRLDTGQS